MPNASLIQDPQSWSVIYTFNQKCATYAHPSHWPQNLKPQIIQKLINWPKSCYLLSEYLLQSLQAQGSYIEDFSTEIAHFALIDTTKLQKLFLYSGAGLWHERLSRILSKEKRQLLESQITKDVYEFALKKAPLTLGKKPPFLFFNTPTEDLYEDIIMASQRLFEGALYNTPYALRARIAFKLPAAIRWDWTTPVEDSTQTLSWNFLKRILLKELSIHF